MSSTVHDSYRLRGNFRARLFVGFAISVTAVLSLPLVANADCNPGEVGYIASFSVKPGSEAEFEAAILELAETVQRVEDGVILYAPFKGVEGKYYMMERYRDIATREKHATSEEVRALFPGLASNLTSAADVQAISALCP